MLQRFKRAGRKSTRSCKISTTQAVFSLSSAEAEFYAAVKAAASGIGCVSTMRDLGVMLQQKGVEVKAKGFGNGVDSPRNQAGCNGRPSHCNATKCRTFQTYHNPNALVATSRDQWRHQDDSNRWKRQLCWFGNKTFGRSDHDQTLEVLWNAFCRRSEPDCTPVGTLVNDSL